MAFLYEKGYCDTFGIPISFISIDLTNVFITVGILIGIIAFWILGLAIITSLKPKSPTLKRVLSPLFGPTWLFLLLLILFWGSWIYLIIFVIAYIVVALVLVLSNLKEKEKTKSEITQEVKTQNEFNPRLEAFINSLVSKIGKRSTVIIFITFFVSFILVTLSFLVGTVNATKQTDFLIPSTNNSSIVLRIYGDNLVCAPFDRASKIMQREYFIIKLGESPTTSFKMENIGPLH